MAVSQAFAVAFGLVFLILGGLYVMVRSEEAAQRHSEHPGGPQSTVWLLAHRVLTVLFVGMFLCVGTWLLIHFRPNVFLAVGLAILFYAHALKHAFGLKVAVLRTTWSAYVLAGLLCGVGSAVHGGIIGILGAILSLVWATAWLWMLKIIWHPRSDTFRSGHNL
jgi:hypothetical protein